MTSRNHQALALLLTLFSLTVFTSQSHADQDKRKKPTTDTKQAVTSKASVDKTKPKSSPGEQGGSKAVELQVGDTAPDFFGTDDNNKIWDSKKQAGQKIYILYFYPADMTPGCTIQACNYRDALTKLKRKDVEVIGISGDAVENHQHFRKKYKLNYTLLADTDGKIAKAFGVQAGKGGSFELKIDDEIITFERGVTTARWTFVIDKDWRVVHKETKVNALKDSEAILKVLKELQPKNEAAKKKTKQPTKRKPK